MHKPTGSSIRSALVVAFVFSAFAGAAAQASNGVVDIIGKAAYAELQAQGKAVRTGSSLALLPAYDAAETIRSAIATEKPGIIVETIFALPRVRPSAPAARKAELAAIYGLLRSFGTLKGIEYYSASHKAMRVLYVESSRIDDPVKRSPLPDLASPDPEAVPASETLLTFQKDLSFGGNVYRYSFRSLPDSVFVEATNLTRMSYGLVPMVSPEGFKSRILVIAADDAIVFYAACSADAPGLVRGRLGESLANRAEALFRWFSARSGSFAAVR